MRTLPIQAERVYPLARTRLTATRLKVAFQGVENSGGPSLVQCPGGFADETEEGDANGSATGVHGRVAS
jgi:hypothetical protein